MPFKKYNFVECIHPQNEKVAWGCVGVLEEDLGHRLPTNGLRAICNRFLFEDEHMVQVIDMIEKVVTNNKSQNRPIIKLRD